jgi:SAM-dependent methyltransferase
MKQQAAALSRPSATLRDRLESVYWWLESVIDPGAKSTQYRYADTLRCLVERESRWMDLGCGHAILPDWVSDQEVLLERAQRAVGVDPDVGSLAQHNQIKRLVAATCEELPFRASVFDRISANMVVEHLARPLPTLREIHRVLRSGGVLLFHTPNARFYLTWMASCLPQSIKNTMIRFSEGRKKADVYPTHYRMNRLQDIHRVAGESGFRVVQCESLNSSAVNSIFLGPLACIDLLIRRILRQERFKEFRSNFIVVLEKV